MYKELCRRWIEYQNAINTKPYNGDNVQAWGMAFNDEWKKMTLHICEDYDIPVDEFSYRLRYDIMPKIMLTLSN